MSSNIRLKRICQHCNQSFIAKTTVTKFCSDDCAKRNYKKRLKESKITKAILQTNRQVLDSYAPAAKTASRQRKKKDRLHQDWISVRDVAELMGIAERTIFRLIKQDAAFPKLRIGRRLLFNKLQVVDYFISKSEAYEGKD